MNAATKVVNKVVRPWKKQTYVEWWQSRIDTLSGFQYESKTLFEKTHVAYPVGPWAILKLALLGYYVKVYTSIIRKSYPAFFLDFFAGPGLNVIQGTGDIVFGSPLLSDRVPSANRKFDRLILVEQNRERVEALRKLLPEAVVIEGDVNATMDEVFAVIPSGIVMPGLVFIDPQGLEIRWKTIERILSRWCDVLINYQTTNVARIWGSYRNNSNYEQCLNDFFGSTDWKNCSSEDGLLDLYVRNLQKHREYVKPVLVKGPGGFHYHIIVAVRKTKGTQGWISAIDRAKANIEQATSEDAEKFLDIYHKRQKTLGEFP